MKLWNSAPDNPSPTNETKRLNRKRTSLVAAAAVAACLLAPAGLRAGTRGADELFWVPTFDQALAMAERTGRPIFFMYYTLVGTRSPTFSGKGTVC